MHLKISSAKVGDELTMTSPVVGDVALRTLYAPHMTIQNQPFTIDFLFMLFQINHVVKSISLALGHKYDQISQLISPWT